MILISEIESESLTEEEIISNIEADTGQPCDGCLEAPWYVSAAPMSEIIVEVNSLQQPITTR